MKFFKLIIFLFVLLTVNGQNDEPRIRGNSDARRFSNRIGSPILQYFRRMLWRAMGNVEDLAEENRKDRKTQETLFKIRPEYRTKFPCDPNGPGKRSEIRPSNVYEVRPGDIDIISAMGDSISSGNGGYSNNILHIANEFRSLSWSGGGKGTFKEYITLPNILKIFNPKLYGYSTGDGISVEIESKLNLAEPMTMSPDLVFQAKTLINRMRTDPNVDFRNHWKMLTIFVGNNDFCSDSCHYKSYNEWVDLHAFELIKALRLLRDKVPNLIVNLIGLPNYTIMYKTKNSPLLCYAVYRVGCHCLFTPNMSEAKIDNVKKGIDLWNERDEQIANMNEFHSDNFAVLYQPFMTNVNFFIDEKKGIADFSYMANDCFHFSQLGHAMAALGIWQNLMEPFGNKTKHWNPHLTKVLKLKCPTELFPYIRVPKLI